MVTGQPPSVVLYGHRRMGKSSILRNLGASLGSQVTVVDFNMQRVGLVDNTGELLYDLTLALYDCISPAQQDQLGEPDEEKFILQTLSHKSLSLTEIIEQTALTSNQVEAALATLVSHDVVNLRDEKYFYTVELMHRWVIKVAPKC